MDITAFRMDNEDNWRWMKRAADFCRSNVFSFRCIAMYEIFLYTRKMFRKTQNRQEKRSAKHNIYRTILDDMRKGRKSHVGLFWNRCTQAGIWFDALA